MKVFSWVLLCCLLMAASMAMGQTVMTCSSDDGQMHACRVGDNSGIQFLRQRSDAACVAGQTYGIRRDGVWVTNGCRADFQVNVNGQYSDNGRAYNQGAYNGQYSQYPDRDRDNDHDGDDQARERRHHDHDRDAYNNGQYGPYNNNGSYNQRGAYGAYNQDSTVGVYPGRDRNAQNGPMPKYYGQYQNGISTCSSDSGSGQRYCQTGGAFSQVQMTRQNGRCSQGQTWGVSSVGLWVADGCSAEFTVQR
jgi:Protein of unknown function (DUF3011)